MSAADIVRIGLLRTGLPPGLAPTFEATKFYEPPTTSFSNACVLAIVEVVPETGRRESSGSLALRTAGQCSIR
jgi:hypothetical protein